MRRSKAIHEEHGLCESEMCGVLLYVGKYVDMGGVGCVVDGMFLASFTYNWQSVGWWGWVVC